MPKCRMRGTTQLLNTPQDQRCPPRFSLEVGGCRERSARCSSIQETLPVTQGWVHFPSKKLSHVYLSMTPAHSALELHVHLTNEVTLVTPLALFFFLKVALTIQGLLWFPTHFRIVFLSISMKNTTRILTGMAFNL